MANGVRDRTLGSISGPAIIQNIAGDPTAHLHKLELDIIWRSGPGLSASEHTILLGRNSIRDLGIIIHGAVKATIGDQVLYTHDRAEVVHDELEALETPDTIQHIREICAEWDTDSIEEETDHFNLDVQLGPSDSQAPRGRPVIRIPFKGNSRPPLNEGAVRVRDCATTNRLSPREYQLYEDALQTLVDGGFASSSRDALENAQHFIAARPVFKLNRHTTKVRVCLDATRINQYTRCGNVLGSSILECLIRFRIGEFVGTFDLEKAFWQVQYHPDDIGWYCTVIQGQALVFQRMIFGANFSPNGLQAALNLVHDAALHRLTVQPAYEKHEPLRPDTLQFTNYVDDFCFRSASLEALVIATAWYRWWLSEHGFPSSKFVMNGLNTLDNTESAFLSYQWNPGADTLTAKPTELPDQMPVTLRQAVSLVASVYDPIGSQLKLQLQGRLLARRAHTETKNDNGKGIHWDGHISRELQEKLQTWKTQVNLSQPQPMARYIDVRSMHVFADASNECWCYEVRDTKFELIFSRGGILPGKMTTPVAELHALFNAVTDTLKQLPTFENVQRISFYTDSQCTVYRINRPKQALCKAEANRVNKIRNLLKKASIPVTLYHIDGELNPADYATRPFSPMVERPPIQGAAITAQANDPRTVRTL